MRDRSARSSLARATAFILALAGCAGNGASIGPSTVAFPAGTTRVPLTTADRLTGGPCAVSTDGYIWYQLADGAFPAIDFTSVRCQAPATLSADVVPPIPDWSHPLGPTHAIFVATSLEEAYSVPGMQSIDRLAESARVPITWMIGNPAYLQENAAYYNQLHAAVGDDVELEDSATLRTLAAQLLPWYAPSVAVLGAGHERDVAAAVAQGNGGFWGITWNSHGTDSTSDEGAPWGTFCADPSSYKRPASNGTCSLVSFEWTARDLTRAYLANTNADGYSAEAAFSTDPDDILERGGFDSGTGAQYVRELIDAYAAAGETQPIVVMSQQEPMGEAAGGAADDAVLGAMYAESASDGMQALTLREALVSAKTFSAAPRAVAFPFLPGGKVTTYNGKPFTPATIDYHDANAGMTFVAGHTLPSRVYEYVEDPVSIYNKPLQAIAAGSADFPVLTGVTVSAGELHFSFTAPVALRFGVAFWSAPATAAFAGATPAGRAGAVATFDLPAGKSTQTVRCGACSAATFTYAR